MSTNIKAVSDQSFTTDVIEASKIALVLVEAWVDRCEACKVFGASLAELAEELADKLTVAGLEADVNQMSSTKYDVRAIPTVILFRNGVPAAKRTGVQSTAQMKDWIGTLI
jgi:thioredoxin 1